MLWIGLRICRASIRVSLSSFLAQSSSASQQHRYKLIIVVSTSLRIRKRWALDLSGIWLQLGDHTRRFGVEFGEVCDGKPSVDGAPACGKRGRANCFMCWCFTFLLVLFLFIHFWSAATEMVLLGKVTCCCCFRQCCCRCFDSELKWPAEERVWEALDNGSTTSSSGIDGPSIDSSNPFRNLLQIISPSMKNKNVILAQ